MIGRIPIPDRPHILVIEDDTHTLDIMARALGKREYHVTVTASVEDALDVFASAPYAVIITDIFMAGMGGIEGIKAFRALAPDILILATSAGYSQMSPREALRAAQKIGADKVLAKPFTIRDLTDAVTEVIAA